MRIILSVFILLIFFSCRQDKPHTYREYLGQTMGTTYHIKMSSEHDVSQAQLDSILIAFNNQVSTYIPDSKISLFNRSEDTFCLQKKDVHFKRNLDNALALYRQTGGYFNPTVMPLVNYWGFGYQKRKVHEQIDSSTIDSLLDLVDMTMFQSEDSCLVKRKPISLDFSALAKGDGVDVIAEFLELKEVENYYIEIGGEVRCYGVNPSGKRWTIGINRPKENADPSDFVSIIQLKNRAIATSGNYRNFYESNGSYINHTVNPFTGYTEASDLLSASIVSESCAIADGLATACMSMGSEKAVKMLDTMNKIDYMLIVNNGDGTASTLMNSGFSNMTKMIEDEI